MRTPQTHEGTVTLGIASGEGTGVGAGGFNRLEQYVTLGPGVAAGAGGLAGTVTDPTGEVVPGAHVALGNQQTGAEQSTTTDSRGVYQFYSFPVGAYSLLINLPGFKTFAQRNIQVGTGRIKAVNAMPSVARTAETVMVETEATDVAEVAPKQCVEAEGRDLGDYFEYNIKQKITIG